MSRILQRAVAFVSAVLLVVSMLSAPAVAHKNHKKKQQEAAQLANQQAPAGAAAPSAAPAAAPATSVHMNSTMDGMDEMDDMDMDRSKLPVFERLYEWFGRLHPAIVHFPIAFFPAAWFTAIVGRRRPAFSAPVQFLVVAGGIFAPIAAVAGWITAADTDPSAILTYHRWLGSGVGIAGLLLGIWAWRRPWEDRGAGMVLALTAMTIAILVQAGLGAIVTHGLEHLTF